MSKKLIKKLNDLKYLNFSYFYQNKKYFFYHIASSKTIFILYY